MRNFISILLIVSLTFLSGCVTPLTSQQRCALNGEVYVGSSINIGQSSNHTTVYQPRCRLPETDEEKKVIEKVQPKAQEIQDSNIIANAGIILGSVVATLAIVLAIVVYKK